MFSFSFQMAHMFPDCIGEVDVVSDAENIKRLLKIPYSNKSVSLKFLKFNNYYVTSNITLKSLKLTAVVKISSDN